MKNLKIEFANGNTENTEPEVKCALTDKNEISQYEMITDILHACCKLSQHNNVSIETSAPYLIANGKTLEVHEERVGFFTKEEPFDIDDDDDHAFITLKKEKNEYTVTTYYGNGQYDMTSKQCVPYNDEKFIKVEEKDDNYIMSAENTNRNEIIDEMIDEAVHTFADDIESVIKILETAKDADIDVSVSAYGEYEMFEAYIKENYFSYNDMVFYKRIRL